MTGKKRETLVIKPIHSGIKIVNKNTGGIILDGFFNLWREKSLCDVKLVCKNEEILAHKAMLMIYSDYFKAMFTIGLTESSELMPEIKFDETSPDALKSLIMYMYTGSLTVTKETVQDIVVLTDLLQMNDIKEQSCQFIEANLEATNCLGIWDFAETYGCTKLLTKAIALLKRRFTVVVQTEEFLNISSSRLKNILHFEDLCLGNDGENEVFRCVIRWLESDVEQKIDSLKEILSLVKLNHVTESAINELTQIAIMQENQEIKQWIFNELCNNKDQPPRQPIQNIYVVGGYLQSRTGPMCPRLRTIEKYDFRNNEWKTCVNDLPMFASGVHVFSIHGKLFCTTFEMSSDENLTSNPKSYSPGFYEYDNIHNYWKNTVYCFTPDGTNVIQKCLQNSGSIAVCSKTNKIYTISESDVHCIRTQLDDGEVIFCDPEQLPNLRTTEVYSNHTAVVYNENLYVFGGDERISASEIFPTAAVYMLDNDEKKWVTKCSMQEPRARFSSAVVGDYIYAVGGFNTLRLRSVERYDPISDTWRYVESMDKERSHFKCVVHQNKIYSMGGKSYSRYQGGARKVLSSCEMYDPDTDRWTYIAPMAQCRCLFGAEVF